MTFSNISAYITENNSRCALGVVQGAWNNYFHQNYHLFNAPLVQPLITINLVGFFASMIFCGMNCCPAKSEEETSPLLSQARLIESQTAVPKVTSKANTAARVLGAMAVAGVQIGLSYWALKWIGPHNHSGPLNFLENVIVDAVKNCTT